MNEYVVDTVGLVTRIERRKHGPTAQQVFDLAESGGAVVYVPSMVFAEILYLAETKRIRASLQDVAIYLERNSNCKEYPMTVSVIQSASEITDVRELHDRLIAGTARLLGLELITPDRELQASSFVRTLW